MSLAAYQRAVARLVFDGNDHALAGARWGRYRTMVRERFIDVVQAQLPRTLDVLGAERFEWRVDAFLRERGPRSRDLRDLATEFVRHGEASWPVDTAANRLVLDLARYEVARREVASMTTGPADAPDAPFSLERPVSLNRAHRLLRVGWNVHHHDCDADALVERPCHLVLYLTAESLTVEVWEVSPRGAELIRRFATRDEDAGSSIRAALLTNGAPDLHAIDDVTTCVSALLERKIILGATTR